jgi:KaiC/GvpD/RAD55 family RecA-like ATPase
MERVRTGIEELDKKMEGGYPLGRTILVTGGTGSGKTILGHHLIYQGCVEDRKCMIIATEETVEDILAQAESVGRNLREYYEKGSLIIDKTYEERTLHARSVLAYGIEHIDELQSNLLGLLERIPDDVDIVLIDNIGVFTLNMSPNEFRVQFDSLVYGLAEKNITSMVITDLSSDERTDGVAAYSAYGVIRMSVQDNPYTGSRGRFLEIVKIRNTRIPLDPLPFDITPEGIVFQKREANER